MSCSVCDLNCFINPHLSFDSFLLSVFFPRDVVTLLCFGRLIITKADVPSREGGAFGGDRYLCLVRKDRPTLFQPHTRHHCISYLSPQSFSFSDIYCVLPIFWSLIFLRCLTFFISSPHLLTLGGGGCVFYVGGSKPPFLKDHPGLEVAHLFLALSGVLRRVFSCGLVFHVGWSGMDLILAPDIYQGRGGGFVYFFYPCPGCPAVLSGPGAGIRGAALPDTRCAARGLHHPIPARA